MYSNDYLYKEGTDVPEIDSYVVMRRLEMLQEHLTELLAVDYRLRDLERTNAVVRAVNFWEHISSKGGANG